MRVPSAGARSLRRTSQSGIRPAGRDPDAIGGRSPNVGALAKQPAESAAALSGSAGHSNA